MSGQQKDLEAQSSGVRTPAVVRQEQPRRPKRSHPMMGQRPMWQAGAWEKLCIYLKSDTFQCAAQSATGKSPAHNTPHADPGHHGID